MLPVIVHIGYTQGETISTANLASFVTFFWLFPGIYNKYCRFKDFVSNLVGEKCM